jgi:hypothetical protein
MIRIGATALAALAAALAPAAPAAATDLASYEEATPVSANRDTAAWSAYDPVARRYELTIYQDGTVRPAPVPARDVPFDVDVGRGPDGGPLLVYSRCARDSSNSNRSRGCDLRALDPATGRERAIPVRGGGSAEDTDPAVWGDRVVFTRRRGTRSAVYSAPVTGGRARRVPLRGAGRAPQIRDKDLLGGRLAVTIGRTVERADAIEVRLQQLDGSRSRRVMRRAIGESGRDIVGLGFDRGRLGFALVCESPECGRTTPVR